MRSAVTLPRNVQQGYFGLPERVSSQEAAGTNTMPSCATAEPVSRVASCVVDPALPKQAGRCERVERIEPAGQVAEKNGVARTVFCDEGRGAHRAVAWKVQYKQPLLAFIA